MFTADNLPEAARAKLDDFNAWLKQPTAGWIANFNAITAIILNRLDAAHGGRLSKLLNGTAAIEAASPTTLPEWAKATPDDLLLMSGKTFSNEADPLNYHAARVLARMPVPALTDEPPKVTKADVDAAARQFDLESPFGGTMRAALDADRARVWQRFRPAPTDPVRFALEKVTDEQWRAFLESVDRHRYTDGHGGFGWPSIAISHLRTELARVLPVAEPPKQWAELTDDDAQEIVFAAMGAYNYHHGQKKSPGRNAALAFTLKQRLSNYAAPPPRKVEVTPEVAAAFEQAWGEPKTHQVSYEAGYEGRLCDHLDGLRAALAVANEQAEARESEEIARLKADLTDAGADLLVAQRDADYLRNEIERLTKERDEAQKMAGEWLAKYEQTRDSGVSLRQHADKLEALLTVDGVDGEKVKLWLPFERRFPGTVIAEWEAAELALGYSVHGMPQGLFARASRPDTPLQLRQSPALEAEPIKRWKIANADEFTDDVAYFVTVPMTRADAEKRGKVIGEAKK